MRDDARDRAADEDRAMLDDMRLRVRLHASPRSVHTVHRRVLRESDDDSPVGRRGDPPRGRSIGVHVHHHRRRRSLIFIRCVCVCLCLSTELQEFEDTARVIPVPVAQDDPLDLRYRDFERSDVPLDSTRVGTRVE